MVSIERQYVITIEFQKRFDFLREKKCNKEAVLPGDEQCGVLCRDAMTEGPVGCRQNGTVAC